MKRLGMRKLDTQTGVWERRFRQKNWFQFEAEQGDYLSVLVFATNNSDVYQNMWIYDPSGVSKEYAAQGSGPAQHSSIVSGKEIDSTGTWQVKLRRYSGEGTYSLSIILSHGGVTEEVGASEKPLRMIPTEDGAVSLELAGWLHPDDANTAHSFTVACPPLAEITATSAFASLSGGSAQYNGAIELGAVFWNSSTSALSSTTFPRHGAVLEVNVALPPDPVVEPIMYAVTVHLVYPSLVVHENIEGETTHLDLTANFGDFFLQFVQGQILSGEADDFFPFISTTATMLS